VIALIIGGIALVALLLVGLGTFAVVTLSGKKSDSRASSTTTTRWTTAPSPWTTTYTPYRPPTTTTTPASRNLFGAFSVSIPTGNVGWAINSATQSGAESLANSKCGVSSCSSVLWFRNACGALAQSQNDASWGWAWSTTRQAAINKAYGYVRGGSPKLIVAKCTSNVSG